MSRLQRGVALAFSLLLAASTLAAQGNRPGTPSTPLSGATPPQLADRNGKIVGPLSAVGGVLYTLPDGTRIRLSWTRESLRPLNSIGPQTSIYFRSTDCSGPAYVDFHFAPSGDPLALQIWYPGSGQPWPGPSEGAEPPGPAGETVLYVSAPGERALLRLNDFQSYIDPMSPWDPCVAGAPPIFAPDGYVPLYRLDRTAIDLGAEFAYPFHVVE